MRVRRYAKTALLNAAARIVRRDLTRASGLLKTLARIDWRYERTHRPVPEPSSAYGDIDRAARRSFRESSN